MCSYRLCKQIGGNMQSNHGYLRHSSFNGQSSTFLLSIIMDNRPYVKMSWATSDSFNLACSGLSSSPVKPHPAPIFEREGVWQLLISEPELQSPVACSGLLHSRE